MNRSNLSAASNPAINFGLFFILAFALVAGTRPVRADDPATDGSATRTEIVSLVDLNLSNA